MAKYVGEGEPYISPDTEGREKCLSLLAAPLFQHLGHNVGYRLAYVYAKCGYTQHACLQMGGGHVFAESLQCK